jgi:periplasmic protein TonB
VRVRSLRQRRAPEVGAGLVGTLLVHGAAVALLLGAVHAPLVQPPVYAVELVAAPAPAPKQRVAPEATPTPPKPEPAPPAPPKTPPKTAPKPEPKPAKTAPVEPPRREPPKTVQPADPRTEEAPKTASRETPLPGETPSTGSDVANIKTPGLQFPYPEYLNNIMNQVLKRYGRPSAALRAEISFLILRDGSVRDIRFVKRSGNFSFDLDAQGAIEAAGNAQAFGPLPDGWEADVLPISFVFEPRRP